MLHAFAPYGRRGPSARVRVYQWLERVGIPHQLHNYAGSATATPRALAIHPLTTLRAEMAVRSSRVGRTDAVLLHRAATPIGHGDVEANLLRRAGLGVYDLDDAIQWERPRRSTVAHRMFPRSRQAVAAVLAADRVIAGNPTLAEWAAGHNSDVRVIPSCVEPSYYVLKRDYSLSDPPLIGWIGSFSTEPYLDDIADALGEVHRRTGAQLVVAGAPVDRPSPIAAFVRRIRWTEAAVHNHAADWDVGIMPLRDGIYERGKCGYKLLQYGSAGLPIVASPVGINRQILTRAGAPAPSTSEEWVDALLGVLSSSKAERAAMGATGRSLVEREYSYAAWQERWVQAIGGSPKADTLA